MRGLTEPFIDEVCAKLAGVAADAKPHWGKMTGADVVPHLIGTVRMSMGEIPAIGFNGNWFTMTLLKRIALTGLTLPPKNIKTYNDRGEEVEAIQSPGDVEALRAAMLDFIHRERGGTLTCCRHSLFGDIGPEGWSRIHVLHTKHHMKQFGVL
jgi:hypothetical protein